MYDAFVHFVDSGEFAKEMEEVRKQVEEMKKRGEI